MTTTVIVQAHCAFNKEVLIEVKDVESKAMLDKAIIQDGETWQNVVYENREVSVSERVKE